MTFLPFALMAAAVVPGQVAVAIEPEIDTLEVSATRMPRALAEVPAAVTVIDGDDLAVGRLSASLAEALARVPGLFVQNAGNFSQDARIALRGFGAQSAFGIRGVMIVVDGVPQTLPDGQAQVDAIDLAAVERIEILRGPASAAYGNAAGGVILIRTRRPGESASASARQEIAAFGRRDSRFALSLPLGPVGLRLSGGHFEQDGFRRHARVEQRRADLKLAWQARAQTRVDFDLGYFDAPEERDPGGLTAEQARTQPRAARPANLRFDAGEALEQWRTALALRHSPTDDQQLAANAFLFARDFSNRLPFADGGQVELDRRYSGIDLRHQIERAGLRVSTGLDWREQHDRRQRFDNLDGVRGDRVLVQREQVNALGAFVQAVLPLGDTLDLSAGLRHDRVRLDVADRMPVDGDDSGARSWRETTPTAGLSWRPDPRWTVYAGYGRVFQTPTTTELANPSDPAAGGGFNPTLGPETADSLELGARWRGEHLQFQAAIFRLSVDDAITTIEVPEFSGSGREFFANAGRSTRRGLELDARWQGRGPWRVELGYTHSDFEFDRFETADGDFSGNRLPGVPRHRLHARIAWIGESGLDLALDAAWTESFFADTINRNRSDARSELALSARRDWSFGDWRLGVRGGVFNLLDQRYHDNVRINAFGGRFFEPAPDRHAYGGIELAWR
ncbi:MAG: TonB-dependent receptor [Wenzhouxiangellaceae bacterium]|nr:TonB-dependent receptor [Wenzhouxiangellaceae bacterium]